MANNFGKDSHMRMKSKRFIALFVGLIGAMALGGAVALAQSSDDTWGSGQANQAWSASSTNTVFTDGSARITCTNATAAGTTGGAPDVGFLALTAKPTFTNCSSNIPGTTVGVTTTTGYSAAFFSDVSNSKCPANTAPDESTTNKDCGVVGVPQNGATITISGTVNCSITIQPNGATTIGGTLTENNPAGEDSLALSGTLSNSNTCGIGTSATWTGTYVIGSVGGSYLDDLSGTNDGAAGPDGDS